MQKRHGESEGRRNQGLLVVKSLAKSFYELRGHG